MFASLQSSSKNAAVQNGDGHFFGSNAYPFIQPKLTVNAPGDAYEQEADAMADRVMRMPDPAISNQQSFFKPSPLSVSRWQRTTPMEEEEKKKVHRKCDHCQEEEKLHRKESSNSEVAAGAHTVSYLSSIGGSGTPLPTSTRKFFEPRFGHDFSEVKIHNDSRAHESTRDVNALAYTHGNNIVFGANQFSPESESGKKLLAHELTHTVQQGTETSIQRSCSDGNCDTCAGGRKTINVTVFFRRRATSQTMQVLRTKINEAKRILNNCCINLLFDFNWRLLSGNRTFDVGVARPAGSADGAWDYTDDAETLGEGNTFTGARGIPMLVVDDTPTASGLTVSNAFDNQYTGVSYMVLPIDTGKTRSIAHELGHVGGILPHSNTANIMDPNLSTNVTDEYCNAVRSIAH